MMIIDAQVHIWAPETPAKPYARGEASEPHRPTPLGHEELLREMNGAGVQRCVLVPPTLGIRMVFNRGRSRDWLDDGTADWFWDAAERYDVPVMTFAPGAVPKLGAIAESHPGLRMIIDHMGLGTALRGKPLDPALDDVIQMARLP